MENRISSFTQEITLPSNGHLTPSIPEGKIIQRCMMVSDQKFLASANLSSEDMVKELITRTTESPNPINIDELTAADMLFILFKLRILSYGSNYKFITRCRECGKKFNVDLDLAELSAIPLDEDYEDKLCVVLPVAGDKVYTKFLTNRDLSDIKKEVERRRKRLGDAAESEEFILRMVTMIRKIELKQADANGNKVLETPVEIQMYLERLTDLDATAIKATTDSLAYGIIPTVEQKCPHCREYVDVNIQFGASFFRPRYDIKY